MAPRALANATIATMGTMEVEEKRENVENFDTTLECGINRRCIGKIRLPSANCSRYLDQAGRCHGKILEMGLAAIREIFRRFGRFFVLFCQILNACFPYFCL